MLAGTNGGVTSGIDAAIHAWRRESGIGTNGGAAGWVQQLTTDCQAIEAFVVPRVLWPDDIGETSRALAVFAVALAPPGTRSEQISDIVRALASVKCVGSRESLDLAIAWGCGAALVVGRRQASRVESIRALMAALSASPVRLAGAVMNEF